MNLWCNLFTVNISSNTHSFPLLTPTIQPPLPLAANMITSWYFGWTCTPNDTPSGTTSGWRTCEPGWNILFALWTSSNETASIGMVRNVLSHIRKFHEYVHICIFTYVIKCLVAGDLPDKWIEHIHIIFNLFYENIYKLFALWTLLKESAYTCTFGDVPAYKCRSIHSSL